MIKHGLPSLPLAAIAAPLAGTLWWMLVDDISLSQAIKTPFPYILLALSWFIATPTYLTLFDWIGGKLSRVLFLTTMGATPFAIAAWSYFLVPRASFAVFLIFSTAWIAALTFWAVLRSLGALGTTASKESQG